MRIRKHFGCLAGVQIRRGRTLLGGEAKEVNNDG